jgi:acyl-CoA synthetase (AMP-forming)/AMP-acid ligase II
LIGAADFLYRTRVSRSERRVFPTSPIPREILDGAETLTGALADMAERFPDYACLNLYDRTGHEEQLSLAAFFTRAREIQSALGAAGLESGGSAVVILPTSSELVAAYFGILFAGGKPALVAPPSHRVADPGAYTRHVAPILANTRAAAVYCEKKVADGLRANETALAGARILTPQDAPRGGALADPVAASPQDIATLQYSSGSTGPPKGVLLSHAAILDHIRAMRVLLDLRPEHAAVNWIPLYHDMGLIDAFLLPLLCGCPTVLIPTMDFMRDPALWLWSIHRYRASLSLAPNFAYNLCATRVSDRDLEGLDLSSWRFAINSSEPVLAETVRRFAARFAPLGYDPAAMMPCYGLAENVTAATGHPPGSAPNIDKIDRAELARKQVARPTEADGLESVSCGPALPGQEIAIRDADGNDLPERRVGAIWVRSTSLFAGYHENPEATRAVLVDGWLDTGDRGYVVDDHLYFVSRQKDLIVIGGEKYAPHDVETAINTTPGVREGCAIAFGVLSAERGTEELAAVVETRETEPEALAALSRAIRDTVLRATGLGIRHLKLVPVGGVKKTTAGKLARSATRERYAGEFGVSS